LSASTLIDPDTLAQRLRQQSRINDPLCGDVSPQEVQQRSPLWPSAARWSAIRLIAVTEQGSRRLEEYLYHPATADCEVPIHPDSGLPVAVMFAQQADGAPLLGPPAGRDTRCDPPGGSAARAGPRRR